MASEQDNTIKMPLNQTESDYSHTTAEQASEEVDGASGQVIATEPTSVGVGTVQDARKENLDAEMIMTFSDVDQNVNPAGSVLNGMLLAELTKESPPSYKRVIIPNKKASTCDDATTEQPRARDCTIASTQCTSCQCLSDCCSNECAAYCCFIDCTETLLSKL